MFVYSHTAVDLVNKFRQKLIGCILVDLGCRKGLAYEGVLMELVGNLVVYFTGVLYKKVLWLGYALDPC